MQTSMRPVTDFNASKIPYVSKHETHLPLSVSVYDEEAEDERLRSPVTLVSYTQSLSSDSITLVGPLYHFGYRYLMGRNSTLQVVLHLPSGPVSLQGFPVRYIQAGEEQSSDGYMLTGPGVTSLGATEVNCLIEVSILVMSGGDREQLTEYLQQLDAIKERAAAPFASVAPPTEQVRQSL